MNTTSCDTALGIPYNVASYAALLHIIAFITDLKPGRLIGSFGDTHLYSDHIKEGHVDKILRRKTHPLAAMDLSKCNLLHDARSVVRIFTKDTDNATYGHILDTLFIDNATTMVKTLQQSIVGYKHEAPIKMNVSV